MRFARLLFSLAAALLLAIPAAAQTVRGVVVDEAQRPVSGMLVRLVTPGGAASGGALTDAQGRFTLTAPAPGAYTVRAERVGYSTAVAPVDVAAGQMAEVRLTTAVKAFVLPAVEVTAAGRCKVRPEDGDAAYTAWDEARKALEVAAVLQEQRRVEYTVRTFGSSMVLGTGRMRREESEPRRVTGNPFHTLAPAELASGGYVREEGDSLLYYGPDASVLLSDEFLDTHCLYIDFDQSQGRMVALAFEPVRRRRVVDIRGTLLLDKATGELREVDYQYTMQGMEQERSRAGGTVEFRKMPSGAWVVSEWRIRTTRANFRTDYSRRGDPTAAVGEIRAAGGEVTDVVLLDQAQP
ncbi:MAG TPA: carboxypeptidase-like regulatory domain-containing protein [Longimicrobium sp.]|nr:carboxypeptidase-like regulatory domain-containing protein [Longimicrobium sp.]